MPATSPLSARVGRLSAAAFRVVDAPEFIVRTFGWSPPNHIFSTVCGVDQEIDWTWTHTPDGSYVSGFTHKRRRDAPRHLA